MRNHRIRIQHHTKLHLDHIRLAGNFSNNAEALEYILEGYATPTPEERHECTICQQWIHYTPIIENPTCKKTSCQTEFRRQKP